MALITAPWSYFRTNWDFRDRKWLIFHCHYQRVDISNIFGATGIFRQSAAPVDWLSPRLPSSGRLGSHGSHRKRPHVGMSMYQCTIISTQTLRLQLFNDVDHVSKIGFVRHFVAALALKIRQIQRTSKLSTYRQKTAPPSGKSPILCHVSVKMSCRFCRLFDCFQLDFVCSLQPRYARLRTSLVFARMGRL